MLFKKRACLHSPPPLRVFQKAQKQMLLKFSPHTLHPSLGIIPQNGAGPEMASSPLGLGTERWSSASCLPTSCCPPTDGLAGAEEETRQRQLSEEAGFGTCRQRPPGPPAQKLTGRGEGWCRQGAGWAKRRGLVLIKEPLFTHGRDNAQEGRCHVALGLVWLPSAPKPRESRCTYVPCTLCDGPDMAGRPH